MDINLIKEYLKNINNFSIPIIQKEFNLCYYDARKIVLILEKEGLVQFKSGIEYVWCKNDKECELVEFLLDNENCDKDIELQKKMKRNLDAIFSCVGNNEELKSKSSKTEDELFELYEETKQRQNYIRNLNNDNDSFVVMDCDFDDSFLFPMIWEDVVRMGNVTTTNLFATLREDTFSDACELFVIIALMYNKDFDKKALIEYISDYPKKFNLSDDKKKMVEKALRGVVTTSDEDFEKVKSLINKSI